jgi:hypothetical protein
MLGGVAEKPHKIMQIRNERFRDTSFVRFDAPVDETGAAWQRTISAHRSSHRSDFWPDRIRLGRCKHRTLRNHLPNLLTARSSPLKCSVTSLLARSPRDDVSQPKRAIRRVERGSMSRFQVGLAGNHCVQSRVIQRNGPAGERAEPVEHGQSQWDTGDDRRANNLQLAPIRFRRS